MLHDTLPPVPPVHCTSALQLRLVPGARARGTLHGCLRVLIVDQFPPRVFCHWIKGYKSPCTCLSIYLRQGWKAGTKMEFFDRAYHLSSLIYHTHTHPRPHPHPHPF